MAAAQGHRKLAPAALAMQPPGPSPMRPPSPYSLLPPRGVRIETALDVRGLDGAVALDVIAHGAHAVRLARQAGDGHPGARVRIEERKGRQAQREDGLFLAGRPLRLHAAEGSGGGEAAFVAALRAAWILPASWFGGLLGTGVEDLEELLTGSRVVHAAHEPGEPIAAARALARRLAGVLGDAPVVCAAFLGPPRTRLRGLGPAIDALAEAAPRADLHASLVVGVARPLVTLWAAGSAAL